MEQENVTIATANAQSGRMIRHSEGLNPFRNTDVLLLSEVVPGRDNLNRNLENAGFQLAYTDGLDLAIAVRKGFTVLSAKEYPLTKNGFLKRFFAGRRIGRLFGLRNMIVAKVQTPTGEQIDVATLHPVPPIRPFARKKQMQAMGEILRREVSNDRLVIGADFNHYPNPRRIDRTIREEHGLKPVDLGGKATYIYRRRGQLDDMLFRGQGIDAIHTDVIDVKSDHRAIITKFLLQTQRNMQQPVR